MGFSKGEEMHDVLEWLIRVFSNVLCQRAMEGR